MSPTLWTGIITIVVGLELVRIAMSTWVLHHILDMPQLALDDAADPRRPQAPRRSAQHARQTWRLRAEVEGLLDPTLIALRNAANAPDQAQALAAADAALEHYLAPLVRIAAVGGDDDPERGAQR